jgi:hypothetical protein
MSTSYIVVDGKGRQMLDQLTDERAAIKRANELRAVSVERAMKLKTTQLPGSRAYATEHYHVLELRTIYSTIEQDQTGF